MIARLGLLVLAALTATALEAGQGRVLARLRTLPVDYETQVVAGRTVGVWRPSSYPAPLIVFSHGYTSCEGQSQFLMQALASDGYLVIAPRHQDAQCGANIPGPPLNDPVPWDDTYHSGRRDDVNAVLASLAANPVTWNINWSQVGFLGHSVGGYTILGLGGGWASWQTTGFGAIVAMSPYCAPFLDTDGSLNLIDVPTMYQGGTLDLLITPSVRQTDGCYDQTPSVAEYVEFQGATHLAWADVGDNDKEAVIIHYVRAFFNWHLRGDTSVDPTVSIAGVSDLRSK